MREYVKSDCGFEEGGQEDLARCGCHDDRRNRIETATVGKMDIVCYLTIFIGSFELTYT